METGTCKIKRPDNMSLPQTANLLSILKYCVGARFLLAVNVNVADKLINGSIGTIEYVHINNPNKPYCASPISAGRGGELNLLPNFQKRAVGGRRGREGA